ncbi:LysE family transporter [Pseudomonas sp. NPDC007930]|uniref:LysE family translocator n=1 Tax=Pseudomonas sp. NPDC007930 TaxID=3364417 RepID=UPI0036EC3B90
MGLPDYLLFCAIAVAQVGSPGPSTLNLINNALAYGPGRALAILSGDLLAIALLAGAALLGLDALLLGQPALFLAVKLLGAGYLVWLGIGQWRQARHSPPAQAPAAAAEPFARLWRRSFMVGLSNPKAMLFFSSLLPQFLPSEHPGSAALLGLIGLFVAVKLAVAAGYAWAAAPLRARLSGPRAGCWGKRLCGTLLLGFGGIMAWNAGL